MRFLLLVAPVTCRKKAPIQINLIKTALAALIACAVVTSEALAASIGRLDDSNVVIESAGDFSKDYINQMKSLSINFMNNDSRFTGMLREYKITKVYLKPRRGYDNGLIFKLNLAQGSKRFEFSSIGVTGYGQCVWIHSR